MHNHLRPAWTVADNIAMLRIIGLSSLMAAMVSSAMAEPPKEQPARKQAVELKGNKLLENFDYHGVPLAAGQLHKKVYRPARVFSSQ
jgi:hypothetical protein